MKKIILFLLFSTLSFGSSLNGVFTELSGVYYDEISDDIKPRQINEHNESMCSLGISKDGEYFATGEPGVIHVWRVKDLKKIKDFYDQNSEEPYRCLNFSFNGNLLAAGSLNNSIKIFNINNGKLMNTFYGHTDTVTHVEFSPNGHLMVSSSDDGTIKIWDVVSGKELKSLKGHSTFVKTVIFTLDGKNLISAGNDRKIRVWDVSTGQQQKVLSGHEDCIFSLDLSSDGNLLASGDANGEIKIWDTLNWNEIASYSQGRSYSYNQQIEDLTFTADNKFIISGSQNGSLMFYDLRKKEVIKEIKNLTPVWSVKISPNFNTIISEDRYKMTLWELYKISYYIARANKDANLYDGYEEHLGILPKNTVVQLNGKKTEIIKPIEAIINSEDFEIFYTNKNNTMFYTVNDTTVYSDVNKIKNIDIIIKSD